MKKPVLSLEEAVADIKDGSVVFVGGFGGAGAPVELVHALYDQGARNLTIVNNNAGNGYVGIAALILGDRVRKIICSFPRSSNAAAFEEAYTQGKIELELVPQGTLAERIRAAGSGIPAFYTPTAFGTPLAEGKEVREFDGKSYILEEALHADVALVRAEQADAYGNLVYHMSGRNFGPIMCMAAKTSIVQVREVLPLGGIDPEHVVTPGIFVDRLSVVENPGMEEQMVAQDKRYP